MHFFGLMHKWVRKKMFKNTYFGTKVFLCIRLVLSDIGVLVYIL